MRVIILSVEPTARQLAEVEGVLNDAGLINRPGEFAVSFDGVKFPKPWPRWLNAGEELSIPADTSASCWNCGASQPAPDSKEQRDAELEESKERVNREPQPEPVSSLVKRLEKR